jgi:hypothetical protein
MIGSPCPEFCHCYLFLYFNNVQVVLTVRDPKGWYRSVTESFWDVITMDWSSLVAIYAYTVF